MKKIIFVQKQDSSAYDPVSTFFANKKGNSVAKPPLKANKIPSDKVKPSNNIVSNAKQQDQTQPVKQQIQKIHQSQKRIASSAKKASVINTPDKVNTQANTIQTNIGRKGQHLPYDKSKYDKLYNGPKKDQTVYEMMNKKKLTMQQPEKRRSGTGKITGTNSNTQLKPKKQFKDPSKVINTLDSRDFIEQQYQATNTLQEPLQQQNIYSEIIQNRKRQQQRNYYPKASQIDENQFQLYSQKMNKKPKLPNISKGNQIKHQQSNQQIQGNNQIKQLKSKIKTLEKNQEQYQRKIADLQERQQKLVKNQQKLNKIQKQHKNCTTEIKKLSQALKLKQQQFKRMLITGSISVPNKDGSTTNKQVKYSKRRELLLQNQINQLKKTNRQLVSRIKNYKGGDLAQMAASRNKTDILHECEDQISHQIERNIDLQAISRLESSCSRIIGQLQEYISKKTTSKFYEWSQEQKYLQEIIKLLEQVSIECLIGDVYQFDQCPDDQNIHNSGWIYNQIENYQKAIRPLIDANDLALAINQQNIQLINEVHTKLGQLKEQEVELKTISSKHISGLMSLSRVSDTMGSIRGSPNKVKRNSQLIVQEMVKKYGAYIQILKKTNNFQMNIIAHSLSENVIFKECVTIKSKKMAQQLGRLKVKLNQLNQIVQTTRIGTKEAIILFVEQNIDGLMIKVPQLESDIKNLTKQFKKISDSSLAIKNQVKL